MQQDPHPNRRKRANQQDNTGQDGTFSRLLRLYHRSSDHHGQSKTDRGNHSRSTRHSDGPDKVHSPRRINRTLQCAI